MLRKLLHVILGTPLQSAQKKPLVNQNQHGANRRAAHQRELIHRESQIGGTLFGSVPVGHHREFFCLDSSTWVWFEEWVDPQTQAHHQMNVHYELQPSGILKTVNGEHRGYVTGQELANLVGVMKSYRVRIAREVYGYAPAFA